MIEQKRELESADIRRLIKVLPHRYPFLLVDRILDIDGDNSAVGIKNVTMNEPHFMGHFPENPIMPGVFIIEAMAQTAGAICLFQYDSLEQFIVLFMTIDHAKFRKPVVPGDQLKIYVKKLKKRGQVFRFSCIAKVDHEKVAEAELTAMITKDMIEG